jgi:uncharacterized membrane protein YgaE (UPF0421/DUF939 family)
MNKTFWCLKGYLGQALKTGVAAMAALGLAGLFQLPESYWAAISAIVVMQSDVGAVFSAGWTRLAGTAIGAIVAVAFVTVWGHNIFAFGAAVTAAILICLLMKLVDSYRLAGVTVAIVMLVGGRPGPPWVIAFHRFAEVSIGIVVALLVSSLVRPSHARKGSAPRENG